MTLQEYIALEKKRLEKLLNDTAPLFIASQTALGDFSERVFKFGQTTTGSRYKYNESRPLYVNPSARNTDNPNVAPGNTSSLKPPRGKPYGGKAGRTKFASTGLPHQTTWVPSYKALRDLVKLESSFINFEAHGDLKSEIENRSSTGVTPRKINNNEYIIRVTDRNAEKVQGLNDRFPNVFLLSSAEINEFNRSYAFEVLKRMREGRP